MAKIGLGLEAQEGCVCVANETNLTNLTLTLTLIPPKP
jgi:hypothetical protein